MRTHVSVGQSHIKKGNLFSATIINVIEWETVKSAKFPQYKAKALVSRLIYRSADPLSL